MSRHSNSQPRLLRTRAPDKRGAAMPASTRVTVLVLQVSFDRSGRQLLLVPPIANGRGSFYVCLGLVDRGCLKDLDVFETFRGEVA